MYTGAEHTATPAYNFTAWYTDRLTFTNIRQTHHFPLHLACHSDQYEPLFVKFCSDGCSKAAACSCYHSHTPWPALHLKNTKQEFSQLTAPCILPAKWYFLQVCLPYTHSCVFWTITNAYYHSFIVAEAIEMPIRVPSVWKYSDLKDQTRRHEYQLPPKRP